MPAISRLTPWTYAYVQDCTARDVGGANGASHAMSCAPLNLLPPTELSDRGGAEGEATPAAG